MNLGSPSRVDQLPLAEDAQSSTASCFLGRVVQGRVARMLPAEGGHGVHLCGRQLHQRIDARTVHVIINYERYLLVLCRRRRCSYTSRRNLVFYKLRKRARVSVRVNGCCDDPSILTSVVGLVLPMGMVCTTVPVLCTLSRMSSCFFFTSSLVTNKKVSSR